MSGGYQPRKAAPEGWIPSPPNAKADEQKPYVPSKELLNARRYALACKQGDVKKLEAEIAEIEKALEINVSNDKLKVLRFRVMHAIESSKKDSYHVFDAAHNQNLNDVIEYMGALMNVRMEGIFDEKS